MSQMRRMAALHTELEFKHRTELVVRLILSWSLAGLINFVLPVRLGRGERWQDSDDDETHGPP
jgi:hypothetical protein